MPVGREALNVFGALLVCALLFGALLTGCGGPGEEGSGNDADAVARSAERIAEPSPGVAQAAAAGVDEASGSESGRRATAGYMKESFEAVGIPARILEFDLDDRRGFNVEATLEGAGGGKHLWVSAH